MINLSNFSTEYKGRKKIIVSDENNKEHRAINHDKDQVRQYRIDKYVIKSEADKKCDYLLLDDNKQHAYFIELKGNDIAEAYRQINNTISTLRHNIKGYECLYRIVHSRRPAVNNSIEREIRKKFAGKYVLIGNKQVPMFDSKPDKIEEYI